MVAIIGWIGSVLCVASLVQKNQLRFRVLNLTACAAMIAFNVANATWSMVLLNVIVAAINVHQIHALRSVRQCRFDDTAAGAAQTIREVRAEAVRAERPERNRVLTGTAA